MGRCSCTAPSCSVALPVGPLSLSPQSFPVSPKLKDLKRQLHLERKRADKLQERLQDILTNSKSRSGEGLGLQGTLRPRRQDLGLNARAASCTSLHGSLVSPDPLELDLSFPFSLYLSCLFLSFSLLSLSVSVSSFCCVSFLSVSHWLLMPSLSVFIFLSLSFSNSFLFFFHPFLLCPFISLSFFLLYIFCLCHSVLSQHPLMHTPVPHQVSLNLLYSFSHSVNMDRIPMLMSSFSDGKSPESQSSRSSQLN